MRRVLLLALALCLPMAANAQTVVTLDIGGRAVNVEMPKGYVRNSEAAPDTNALIQKSLPDTNLLIDAFVDAGDLQLRKAGREAKSLEYEVQVLRAFGTLDVAPEQWARVRPEMIRQLGAMDTSSFNDEMQKNAGKAVEDETGGAVKLEIGEVSRPMLYGNDPESIRFMMILPATYLVGEQKVERRVVVGAVVTVVSRRLVFLYAQRLLALDETPDLSAVRTSLDAFAARVRALNP